MAILQAKHVVAIQEPIAKVPAAVCYPVEACNRLQAHCVFELCNDDTVLEMLCEFFECGRKLRGATHNDVALELTQFCVCAVQQSRPQHFFQDAQEYIAAGKLGKAHDRKRVLLAAVVLGFWMQMPLYCVVSTETGIDLLCGETTHLREGKAAVVQCRCLVHVGCVCGLCPVAACSGIFVILKSALNS